MKYQRTNERTDGRTDARTYKVALSRLKTEDEVLEKVYLANCFKTANEGRNKGKKIEVLKEFGIKQFVQQQTRLMKDVFEAHNAMLTQKWLNDQSAFTKCFFQGGPHDHQCSQSDSKNLAFPGPDYLW